MTDGRSLLPGEKLRRGAAATASLTISASLIGAEGGQKLCRKGGNYPVALQASRVGLERGAGAMAGA